MKRYSLKLLAVVSCLFCAWNSNATVYYVAPNGDNANNGTIESPFATVEPVQSIVQAGDTVYFRGGTYQVQTSQMMREYSVFAQMNYLRVSGEPDKYINYWAYPGEQPVFDFSLVKPTDLRVVGFYIEKNTRYLHFKGLEVTGVQVTITAHTESYCIYSYGDNNIFEGLRLHDNQGTGLRHRRGGGNLFLNCDAYRNHDYTSEDGTGGNTDGFGCHPEAGGTGNIFRGCRSWFNSDDGYDLLGAAEPVIFEHCYAFYNGYDSSFNSLADGNGFKAGGYGSTAFTSLPAVIPPHTIRFCVAVGNKQAGFYTNHHLTGDSIYNNTAYNNRYNYKMLMRKGVSEADYLTDVDGYGIFMRNNLGYKAKTQELVNIDKAACDLSNNYWDGSVTVTADDFKSLDESLLTVARNADYTLPETNFLQLTAGSDLIDAGTPFGDYSYHATAPDLGAFESAYVGVTTGVGDLPDMQKVNIFPNPATNRIYTTTGVERMELFDLSGKLISATNYSSLDISHFNRGMYLVHLVLEDGTSVVSKCIKQ
ncbi:right-handed parallel beta-helix repeat-containing protein [Mangrovibacterium lignilyticum]|uniref:right-handed parallel beta-helix repeat-containing protein n=1 Tax=Mangrovibacterium lignilyticum TaxID=2668052 RepID=UPI0013D6A447|nr:T9SS type A sorting domain-containing protein [Mangrovibacterium lignilyticum]